VAGEQSARNGPDRFRWGPRRSEASADVSAGDALADAGRVVPSRVFPKFLAALARRENPTLVDLGPVVGDNITFFGERLGCKIFVEDLFAEIERRAQEGSTAALPDAFEERFRGRAPTVDGVLCWDVFDHLERPAAQALASHLVRILKPGGSVFGLFGTAEADRPHYTKYVIVDADRLRHRPYPAADARRHILLNRDIIRLFAGLEVAESVLLQINIREILFRKP